MIKSLSFILLITLFTSSCTLLSVKKHKDITYLSKDFSDSLPEKKLNVFASKKASGDDKVLIFIHGGSWNSGNKDLYGFLGRRMALKGIVTVIINYPLSPEYKIDDMATAAAKSVQWVKENISEYGGNPDKIFISGHSAGGHIAALITLKEEYITNLGMKNPLIGAILIDAAGLDMYSYLRMKRYAPGTSYLKAFTNDSVKWKESSPIYFIDTNDPPLLIMMGGKTLPGIISTTEDFLTEYENYVPEPNFHLQKHKRHIPMILQFFNTRNRAYDWILDFMEDSNTKKSK
ncbi:hypothetical protein GCM10011506_43000 [Marivirga lumbricoides]|uniref:BD-FAE-like domain-containing protein n=1 Tax=Marivirga lumbricoides TaxID=1046115 RepID=A0ABQ1N3F1_9BACT|nr:hypothetical protein GCM10011506_43000 [Marivirga lumbricoides]